MDKLNLSAAWCPHLQSRCFVIGIYFVLSVLLGFQELME